jgi:hypothetical protein
LGFNYYKPNILGRIVEKSVTEENRELGNLMSPFKLVPIGTLHMA